MRTDAALSRVAGSLLDEQRYRAMRRKQPSWQNLKKISDKEILKIPEKDTGYSLDRDICEVYADPELPLAFRNLHRVISLFQKDLQRIAVRFEEGFSDFTILL